MSDLVKLLREKAFRAESCEMLETAADRIEKLEAEEIEFDRVIGNYASENALFRDRIEKLEAALREITTRCDATRLPGCDRNGQWAADTARKALEGKDE